ncbi:sodium-independent sulfate anion transporter isoform X4 [Erinaceus europaeus]|uniref:Sodium-independent sulfate anion transporter isoform X4 n=1 Tax=Erinaceus europaeus TaxID=9365 RepID=A0ABM3VU13_ERIEU|nr:sodium-independent sulfate anion transporter isoform X4 [Erinaceus europaeus]
MPSPVKALGQPRPSSPTMDLQGGCCCSPAALQKGLPILGWLPDYSLQWLKMDFIAGLSVGLTVIPQALAYAEVAGLPPQVSCWISSPALSLKASPLQPPSPLVLGRSRTSWACKTSQGSFSFKCFTLSATLERPARNALVVSFAALIAYSFEVTGYQPFVLTGETAKGLPPMRVPPFSVPTANGTISFSEMVQGMGTGLAVVPLMGLLESIAVAKSFASQNNYRVDANQELLAIGLTNMLGSLVSAYPVTGSFGRTAVNAQSGVCTPAGGLVTGVLVLLSLGYLTSLFYFIPKSALAAVIIMAVVPLFDTKIFGTLWHVKRLDLLPFCTTFLLCFWEVQYGILAGALVSLLLLLHAVARPKMQVSEGPVLLVLQPDSGLHFPAVEALREVLMSRALEVSPPRCAILDCSHICSLDYTVVLGLGELLEDFHRQGVTLALTNLQVPVLRVLLSANLKGVQYFSTLEEAEKYLKQEPGAQPYNISEESVPEQKVTLLKV